MSIVDALTLFSSSVSALAVIILHFESKNKSDLFYLKSDLGLLFFTAGIFQWFLFGISQRNLILTITCGIQLPFLFLLNKQFFKKRLA